MGDWLGANIYPKGSVDLTLKDDDVSLGKVDAFSMFVADISSKLIGCARPPDAEESSPFSDVSGSLESSLCSSGVVLTELADVALVPSLSLNESLERSLVFESLLSDGQTRAIRSASLDPFACSNLRRTAGAGRFGRRKKLATTAFLGKVGSGVL